jgi:glutamate synthase domain-containing protein 1
MKWENPRIPSGCAIVGFINEDGKRVSGEAIACAIANMRERSNGLGGGFAAYGIYPDYKEYYAMHMMFADEKSKTITETFLHQKLVIVKDEEIPTRPISEIKNAPILWRYFVEVPAARRGSMGEEDYMVDVVMTINSTHDGAFVASSGKDMGAFKAVGYPEDVARFYRIEDYGAYTWTAHGRFPTNTPGWWGGAHPFSLLDWSVVHNGEISSYGINRRYLESFHYKCTLQTDTEVLVYAFDLLMRKHGLTIELASQVLSAPFWKDIDKASPEEREIQTALRMVYSSLLMTGPFSILVARQGYMFGLTDRIKLRPMVAARHGETLIMATEESAIREVWQKPDEIWIPQAGVPIIGRVGRMEGGQA